MIQNRKSQQGVFIGVFALATLVVISLAIGFMSNRVNELLVGQGQMISGKQAYWSAYSGMELLSGSQLADASNTGTKTYSFSGGTIAIVGEASAALYNGTQRTNVHTVTGVDGNSSRQIKWTLGNPSPAEYALFLKNSNTNQNTDWVEINNIQSKMAMNGVCDEGDAGHDTKGQCDARAAEHENTATGHFNITYVDGSEAADYTVSFWVRPDFETMQDTDGNMPGTEIGSHETCIVFGVKENDGTITPNGAQIGIWTQNGTAAEGYLNILYSVANSQDHHTVNDAACDGGGWQENSSATQMTSNNWYHVAYKRTVSDGYGYAYVNGVYQGKHVDDGFYAATDLWSIGTDLDPDDPVDPTNNFAGLLDEVAVWKTALSEAQIQSLYIQGKSFDIFGNMGTNLVAYWNFDNNSNDQSGNNNHATITGAAYTGF